MAFTLDISSQAAEWRRSNDPNSVEFKTRKYALDINALLEMQNDQTMENLLVRQQQKQSLKKIRRRRSVSNPYDAAVEQQEKYITDLKNKDSQKELAQRIDSLCSYAASLQNQIQANDQQLVNNVQQELPQLAATKDPNLILENANVWLNSKHPIAQTQAVFNVARTQEQADMAKQESGVVEEPTLSPKIVAALAKMFKNYAMQQTPLVEELKTYTEEAIIYQNALNKIQGNIASAATQIENRINQFRLEPKPSRSLDEEEENKQNNFSHQ